MSNPQVIEVYSLRYPIKELMSNIKKLVSEDVDEFDELLVAEEGLCVKP